MTNPAHISPCGLKALRLFEGVRREVYLDPIGLPTIGVGHLLTKPELSSGKIDCVRSILDIRKPLTDELVDLLLSWDIEPVESVIVLQVVPSLTQPQFDALCSFTFNIGVAALARSTLLRLLNQGKYDEARDQFKRWIYAGGRKLNGLVRRRALEAAMWDGEYPQ
jgi:lysozyme